MVRAHVLRMILAAGSTLCLSQANALFAGDVRDHVHEIRRFTFEESEDRNFDREPDEWSRRKGPQFPDFVPARIDRTTGYLSRNSLRFELNGAPAAYYSPLVRVERVQSYLLRGYVRTKSLQHDSALLTLSVLDAKRRRLRRLVSRPVSGTSGDWQKVELGPVAMEEPARYLVVGCHVAGEGRHDVRGDVWFDELWLGSVPELSLQTADDAHYFRPNQPISLEAEVRSVLPEGNYQLLLELEDSAGQVCDRVTHTLPPRDKPLAGDPLPAIRWNWNLPALPNGFYRARGTLQLDGAAMLEAATTLVVLDEPHLPGGPGEFGWSLPDGAGSLPLPTLAKIVPETGIGWIKLPMWTIAEGRGGAEFDEFLDGLERMRVHPVGMLTKPPPELAEKFVRRDVDMRQIFVLPRELWAPSLESLVAGYAFRVRHWQLGHDADDSLVGLDKVSSTISAVKREFDRVGHDTRIGCRWSWDAADPPADPAPPGFLSVIHPAGKTADDLQAALAKTPAGSPPRWVILEPLPSGKHSTEDRSADLARRMLAAKVAGVETIFAANPLSADAGLIARDGAPGELFVPWRTFALALSGASFIGSLELPSRSPNALFQRGPNVVLAVWNDQPTQENLYLGEGASVVDVWGRSSRLDQDPNSGSQSVSAGPTPRLIVGSSAAVARWRLAVRFERGRIPSEYGKHAETLLVTNTFEQPVRGEVTLHMPSGWEVEPGKWTIQAAAGETVRLPMLLKFPVDASLGDFRPHVDFEVHADRQYRFTQPLNYRLGTGDVVLEATVRRTPEGRLEVVQKIINNTSPSEPLSFTCQLFVPGQIRQKQVVPRVGATSDTRLYRVANAQRLTGKDLWLHVEQIDGRRVLNQHLSVP